MNEVMEFIEHCETSRQLFARNEVLDHLYNLHNLRDIELYHEMAATLCNPSDSKVYEALRGMQTCLNR